MKIGYFVSTFPYKNPINGKMKSTIQKDGGVQNSSYNLALQMAKKGHEVFIFTSSMDSSDSVEKYENITVYRYKSYFKIGDSPISFSLLYKPILSDIDLDIIHAHLGNLPAPLSGLFYAKIRKKPFTVTYHAEWVGGFGSVTRRFCVYIFNRFLCDKILSNANIVIALSKENIQQYSHLLKHSAKTKVIPNAINLKDFEIPHSKQECRKRLSLSNDKKIILFVGSLTPIKAPQVLLKAMEYIKNEIPNSYLIFVGSGICKEKLEQLSCKLNIQKNVMFVGYISDLNTKVLYYKSADVFVLPSFTESFGIVLLEASACELPLIVSKLPTFDSIIKDGYNGLVTEKGDERDLANKIIYLFKNDGSRKLMGENAKQNLVNYSWEKVAEKTEELYFNLGKEKNV